jgi:hypothetical protein
MVESPAQSGRLKTLIHPGPVFRVLVTFAKDSLGRHSQLFGDQDGKPFPGTGELRKRLLKAFDGIRCHELRMGPALYQPEHMRHLIGQLLS